MTTTRRTFLISIAAASAAASSSAVRAQTKLEEANTQAAALGYVHDTTKADSKKYPKHDKAQRCNNCVLWQSKVTDAWGNCPIFAGKQVNAKGWCVSWAKKA